MITKITGEAPFQVLTNNFSISPSQEGYTLQISADGKQFSNLFTVGAGVTRLVTGVAAASYYRLSGNQSEVSINWIKTCVTEGGSGGGSGTELTPVTEFPVGVEAGTVVALVSGDTVGIYQYNGTNWILAGGDVDLSAYWTSAQTQSAITAVEDHLFDVEEVTASALTELHEGLLDVSAETMTYVNSATTVLQDQIDIMDQVISQALVDLDDRIVEISGSTPQIDLSGYYTSAQTETAIATATQDMVSSTYISTIWKGTQAQYDAIVTKDPDTFYIIVNSN